jgi:hypothetical protein
MSARKSKRRRGRPSFKPTRTSRATVERMVACGDSQETIARAIGIDEATLRKHFADELATGYAKRRRQVVDMLFTGASKGNASLIKRLEEMTRAAGAAAEFDQPARPPKPAKLGKKDAADLAARTAAVGSDWGDDLTPGTKLN